MTVPIMCNKNVILYLSNMLFNRLHKAILKIAEKRKVLESSQIALFIEETDQDQYGAGNVIADIADYFKNKQEALLFAEIVKEAIEETRASFLNNVGSLEILNNFHQELLNYAQELPE